MNKKLRKEIYRAFQKSYLILILFITCLVVGFEYYRSYVSNPQIKKWQIERFQKTFFDKEKEAEGNLSNILEVIDSNYFGPEIKTELLALEKEIYKKGGIFYIYENDTIIFWSNNSSEIPYRYSEGFGYNKKPVDLGNAIYYSLSQGIGEFTIVYLMKMKDNYSIKNDLLQNKFQKDFDVGQNTTLSIDHCLNCAGIYNSDGKRVFSIKIDDSNHDDIRRHLKVFLYIAFINLILFFLFVIIFTGKLQTPKYKNIFTFGWIVLLIMIRIGLMLKTENQFHTIELFRPSLFAASDFLSSLGDLILHALFFFVMAVLVYENFTFVNWDSAHQNRKFPIIRFYLHMLLIFVLMLWFEKIFSSLIQNSNISFEIHKVLNTNRYTFIALLSIVIIYTSIIILFDKVIITYKDFVAKKQLNRYLIIGIIIFSILTLLLLKDIITVLFFILTIYLVLRFRLTKTNNYNLSRITFLIFIFSIFCVYYIIDQVSNKQLQNKKVLAVNLETEHDYITEMLLESISQRIQKDKRLLALLEKEYKQTDEIHAYLKSKYFNGYLDKYEVESVLCMPADSIYITPDNEYFHCYGFFEDYVNRKGISVPNTNFYFVDDLDGRIGYFGTIVFNDRSSFGEYTLFIEMLSKLVSSEFGYPELLLDKEQQNTSVLNRYSYAKYYDGLLIAQSGDYQYALREEFESDDEFKVVREEGYRHVMYFPNNRSVIIISHNLLKSSDILFTFSYLFLFNIFSILIIVFLYRLNSIEHLFVPTFRNKIQLSMMIVLVVSLVMIGGLTIYYSLDQYKNKHFEFISEKLRSVQIELEHKLGEENELTRSWNQKGYDNLDALLRKFSNVFFTDIHLYDPGGSILASSRPEIFINRLQGSMINPDAYYQLVENNRWEYIHEEEIGNLNYLSGYIPFFNNSGDLLAFLNLPYFTRQKIISEEITSLGITIINIYVLLFLISTFIAFIMSEQITKPLKLIQESFRRIKLGKQNEPIQYSAEDEIAGLVNEYNRMVVELSENAEKLARSEREMAWREMARQIAHEIKNPLTPMKLNVQQLQRAWKDKSGNLDDMLDKVAATLIEQINSLSSIATEFSNFAKIPQPRNEVVNIVQKIKNTVSLFDQTKDVTFETKFNGYDEINIYADKEQISRVFTNLVKNAIQSIRENKKGKVSIETEVDKNKVKIYFRDNGRGIPDEIQNKLFQPNFTTKTSGMGLGLPIVKKIVDTTNGNIYFESEKEKGTCFTVEWELFV